MEERFKSDYRSDDRICFYRYYHSDSSQRHYSSVCLLGSSPSHSTDVQGDKSEFHSFRRSRLHLVAAYSISLFPYKSQDQN